MGCLSDIFHVSGNLALLTFAIPAKFVAIRFHADQIDHAAQVLLFSDRQLQRNNSSSKRVGERVQHSFRICSLTIHAARHNDSRRLIFLAIIPDSLRDYLHPGHSINDD